MYFGPDIVCSKSLAIDILWPRYRAQEVIGYWCTMAQMSCAVSHWLLIYYGPDIVCSKSLAVHISACGTGCEECTSDASDVVTCTDCMMTYYLDQGSCSCKFEKHSQN